MISGARVRVTFLLLAGGISSAIFLTATFHASHSSVPGMGILSMSASLSSPAVACDWVRKKYHPIAPVRDSGVGERHHLDFQTVRLSNN